MAFQRRRVMPRLRKPVNHNCFHQHLPPLTQDNPPADGWLAQKETHEAKQAGGGGGDDEMMKIREVPFPFLGQHTLSYRTCAPLQCPPGYRSAKIPLTRKKPHKKLILTFLTRKKGNTEDIRKTLKKKKYTDISGKTIYSGAVVLELESNTPLSEKRTTDDATIPGS